MLPGSLLYCVHHLRLGISQAGTENAATYFQMGPLCSHKSTNSFSANSFALVGQLCVSVSGWRMNERFLVAERDRKTGAENRAMPSFLLEVSGNRLFFLASSARLLLYEPLTTVSCGEEVAGSNKTDVFLCWSLGTNTESLKIQGCM